MEKQSKNIVIGGVGGQGILKMSDILCETALIEGYDVKKSEVHGMAQRGGSVTSHVKFGEEVYSPLVEPGTANIVITLELLEALRYSHFTSHNGILIYDDFKIDPPVVYTGLEKYPDYVENRLNELTVKTVKIQAFKVAIALKNSRTQNVVMLGAMADFLPFKEDSFFEAMRNVLPEKFIDVNIKAFREGRKLIKKEV